MVISLDEWSDFPRGLRIMILDEDSHFASQTKATLESFHYIVSTFNQESDALDALEQDNESYHVALVDATTGSGGVKFLEAKPDMPTVMMSSKTCLNTMMKCIALGAVEFLQKPVVEDKLKNIWQHVVHKAFSGGDKTVANSLKPVKASIMSLLHLMSTSNKSETEEKNVEEVLDDKKEGIERSISEKFAAPSTPQIQGGRSSPTKLNNSQDISLSSIENKVSEAPTIDNSKLDNVFSPDNSFQSVRREIDENDKLSSRNNTSFSHMRLLQSVDNTCDLFVNAFSSSSTSFHHPKAEEEVSSVVGSQNTIASVDTSIDDKKKKTSSKSSNKRSNPSSGSKKKLKVEWTPELHKRFVQAVEQLGVDQAIPSKILDIMKVDGLTRHNIASHLQKYRANRRHIKMREDEVARGRSWSHWTNNHHNAKLAPGYQQPVQPASLHVWGCPASEYLNARHRPIWQQQVQAGTPATWPSHTWNQPMGYTEAWSCPTPTYGAPQYHHSMLKPYSSSSSYLAQNSNQTVSFMDSAKHILNKPVEEHPAAEEIEEAIKEALKNPWGALPLGLKPPSMDSVIAELQRQGINKIPPMTK